MLNELIEKISAQQKGKEDTDVWMVGEQLKEICKNTPGAAELVLRDLDIPEMSIDKCADKIKEYADEIQKKNKSKRICVPPQTAEKIIREFYGIHEKQENNSPGVLSLADLI